MVMGDGGCLVSTKLSKFLILNYPTLRIIILIKALKLKTLQRKQKIILQKELLTTNSSHINYL